MFPLNITTAVAAAPSAADVAPSPAVEEQPPSHPSLDHQARLPTSFDVEDESRTPDSSGSSTSSPTISPASHTPIHDVEPYPHCPIFVPSKGRSEMERGTLAMLVRELIPFAVVVEKEEEAAYGQLLDRLVYQNFGVADMTADAGGTTTVCPLIGGSHGEDDVPGRYDHLFAKGADVEQTQAEREARARDAAMKRVSSVFHNGFQFVPPGVAVNSDSTTNKYSAAFTLRDVSAVRSLFKVKTMHESDKGVSYVRNYILHVLAPQAMVSAGIHTGLSELGYGDVKMLDLNELRLEGCSVELLVAVEESEKEEARFAANPPHSLYGFYWVLDDDIFYFNQSRTDRQKNVRISTREAMRQCESRLRHLREKTLASATASSSASPSNSQPTATMTYRINPNVGRERFTGREDMMLNNTTHSSGSPMTLETYDLYSKTACFSLEYSRYAYTYDDSAMAVNSYNNIACLWNYRLLHNPQSEKFFPEGLPTVRTPFEVLNYYGDSKMLWYRLPVREDYDFTLQLIARGMHTVRFRSLSFEVPQMAKLKGGMTDYYKNCVDEIREQNHLFVSMWPSVSQLCLKGKNSTEREDIRVEWKLLHPSRARHPGAFLFLREPLPQLQPPRRSPAGSPPDASPVEAPQPISPSAPVVLRQQKQPPIILKRPREDELLLAPPPDMSSLPIDSAVASAIDISKAAESDALELPTDSSNRSQWRGYTVERWRELHPAEAARLGLELLEQVSPGQTVAVVLPLFSQRPPLVLATVIEESRIDGETVWTVIAQRVRGIPVLTVRHCFARPSDDIGGIDGACQRIDAFFEHVDGEKNAQRRREQELLLDD